MKCIKCEKSFDSSMFYKDKSKPSGFKPRCKECEKLYINKGLRREYEKSYYAKEENKERKRKIVNKCNQKNKEKYAEKRKQYLKTDAGISMYRKQTQKRYAMKKKAFIEDVSPIELFNEQSGVCYICEGVFSFKEMELDHILPIAKNGKHEKINCKMACIKCNRSKGSKLLSEVMYQMV